MAERDCGKCFKRSCAHENGCTEPHRSASNQTACSDFVERVKPNCSKCVHITVGSMSGCGCAGYNPALWRVWNFPTCPKFAPKVVEVKAEQGRFSNTVITFTAEFDSFDIDVWNKLIKDMAAPEEVVIDCQFTLSCNDEDNGYCNFIGQCSQQIGNLNDLIENLAGRSICRRWLFANQTITSICGDGLKAGDVGFCHFPHLRASGEDFHCDHFTHNVLFPGGYCKLNLLTRCPLHKGKGDAALHDECPHEKELQDRLFNTEDFKSEEVEDLVPGMPGYCFYRNIDGICECLDAHCDHKINQVHGKPVCGLKPSWKVG